MAQQATLAGVQIHFKHHVSNIQQSSPTGAKVLTMKVKNDDGSVTECTATSRWLILNLAMRPTLTLLRESELPPHQSSSPASSWEETWRNLLACHTNYAVKLYLCYPRAWWIENLGREEGDFSYGSLGSKTTPHLAGRYHDGPVVCPEGQQSTAADRCDGCLLVHYTSFQDFDQSGAYYRQFQADREEPVTIITNATVEGAVFLSDVHDSTMSVNGHTSLAGTIDPPTEAVLATWNMTSPGFGSGMHSWIDNTKQPAASKALEQFGIYLTNEAWYENGSGRWAEYALSLAENFLTNHFGLLDYNDASLPTCSNGGLNLALCPGGCAADADCNLCAGETCDITSGSCLAGTPVVCADTFCNPQICIDGSCQAGSDPCSSQLGCDEVNERCIECDVAEDCDDGAFCNGPEICVGGSCQAGSDPCPGAGCDEAGDVCVTCAPVGADCNDNADCCGNKCKGPTNGKTCK